jgi:hypothetical protein
MSSDVLSWKYSDSDESVRKGDVVMVDDRCGVVQELCMPDSPEAENYYCEDTGGVLIKFEDGLLELLPFGHHHRIEQRRTSPTDPK